LFGRMGFFRNGFKFFLLAFILLLTSFAVRTSHAFQQEEKEFVVILPVVHKNETTADMIPTSTPTEGTVPAETPNATQGPDATGTPTATPTSTQEASTPVPATDSAAPVMIAFTADSEALTLWPEVLALIKKEGAELISVQGDYWGQTKDYLDWVDSLQNGLDAYQDEPFVSNPPVLGPATGAEIGPPRGPYADRLAYDFYNTLTYLEDNLGATWGGCIGNGDKYGTAYPDSYFRVPHTECKVTYNGPDRPTSGRAGDYWLKYKGISLVFQNHQPDVKWPVEAFAAAGEAPGANIWKLCLWHGNHLDFNVFSKGHAYDEEPYPDSSLPYGLYQACADAGALVINGNTHQYTRTCVLDNIGDWRNGGANNAENERNRIERDPSRNRENHTTTAANCPGAGKPNAEAHGVEQLTIGPGRSMVLVSSLGGGFEMRDYIGDVYTKHQSKYLQDRWRHDFDGWWSTIFSNGRYCRNNCTRGDLSGQDRANDLAMNEYTDIHGAGALFIVFNYQGDPYKAHGYFKTIKGQIIDEFMITYQP
jgi:hypothetical protein